MALKAQAPTAVPTLPYRLRPRWVGRPGGLPGEPQGSTEAVGEASTPRPFKRLRPATVEAGPGGAQPVALEETNSHATLLETPSPAEQPRRLDAPQPMAGVDWCVVDGEPAAAKAAASAETGGVAVGAATGEKGPNCLSRAATKPWLEHSAGKHVRMRRTKLLRRPPRPRKLAQQQPTTAALACNAVVGQAKEVRLQDADVAVGKAEEVRQQGADPADAFTAQVASKLLCALEAWREALEASGGEAAEASSEAALSVPLLSLARRLAAMATRSVGARLAASLLQALPTLLDVAATDRRAEASSQSSRQLVQRLESDKAFAEEHVRSVAEGDAAADLRLLEAAVVRGVRLSKRLYRMKLAKERLVQINLAHIELRHAERRMAACASGPVRARAAAVALLAAHGTREVQSGSQGEYGADAAVAAAEQLSALPSPASLAAKFVARPLPTELASDEGMWRHARALGVQLLALPGHRPLAAAAALAGVLKAAALAEVEGRVTELEAEKAEVEARHEEASRLASSPPALEDALRQSLACGSWSLEGAEELLRMLPDEDARAHAMEELRAKMLRDATLELRRTGLRLSVVDLELEALAFQEEGEPAEAPALASTSEAAAAAAVAAAVKPCAAVSAGDWARLEEEQHLNDAVLDLFINLMVRALGGPRVHAFSSLFFSRLSSSGARDGFEGWRHVRTWTKGARRAAAAGIFACDALFVPVHHKTNHWSLAVVCRPWAAAKCAAASLALLPSSEERRQAPCGAVVAFLNSLGRDAETEACVLHFLRGYLSREWEDCLGLDAGSYRSELLTGVSVDVPAQQNDSDCGVFVLEFVLQLLRRPDLLATLGRRPLPLEVCDLPRQRWRRAGAAVRAQGCAEAGMAMASDWLQLLT